MYENNNNNSDDMLCKYDLNGVVVHGGTLNGGHYSICQTSVIMCISCYG